MWCASCPSITPPAPMRTESLRGGCRGPRRMQAESLGRKAFAVAAVCLASAWCGAAGSAATTSVFHIDAARSKVGFELDAPGHIVHGTALKMKGEVAFDPEDLSRGAHTQLEVEARALSTANKVRDKKMREAHLEVARYPEIVFRSTRIDAIAPTLRPGETQELGVSGLLSLHGVERKITFSAKAVRNGNSLRVTGEVPLKLSDFGIPIPRFLFLKMKDQIKVAFEVVAVGGESR
jgi:polyisoprenoid-binding protein YceI